MSSETEQECQTDTKYTLCIYGKFNGNNIFLGAGYLTWRTDTAISVFRQFKCHNSGVGDLAGYRTWSRYYAHQHIPKFDKDENSDLESGNPVDAVCLPQVFS